MSEMIVRYRGWIAVAWLAVCAALIPATGRLEQTLDVSARIEGSQAAAVEKMLADEFHSPFAQYAVLVVGGVPSPDHPHGREVLREVVAGLYDLSGLTRSFSYLDLPDPLFLGSGGSGTFIIVGLDSGAGSVDALIPQLREGTTLLLTQLRREFPHLTLRWTGDAPLNFDLRRTSTEQARAAEQRVLPLTIALLLLAFGAVIAAILPVVIGFLAIALGLGAAVVLAQFWPMSILVVNVVSMIGLGVGIDYALLTVSRFRESISAGPIAAAQDAASHAGRTVMLSGTAVAIGFTALLLLPINEIRSIAVGGLLVIVTSAALASTLLPGVLACMGKWLEFGRVRRFPQRDSSERKWRAWGHWIARHPALVLIFAGIPVLLLASQAPRLNTEIPRGNWLPPGMESARAIQDLEAMGRSGVIQAVRVVLELPDGITVRHPDGWAAVWRLIDSLAADPHVDRVRFLPSAAHSSLPDPFLLSLYPRDVLRSFVSDNERAVLLEVIPRQTAASGELTRWVRKLRAAHPADLTGLRGTNLRIGGLPAFNADYEDAVAERFVGIVAFVVLGTFIALLIGFRSILIPIKALALNVLSVAAAFGALVLVFQDGYGIGWVGIQASTEGVFPAMPILVFCTVFGLSMDYEVFLVARVAEARRAGMDETAALAEGLAKTGGVITSAAAIMIAVFAAFALGDFLLIKMLGFSLAVAILLDATVVRMAIGPALLRLAGHWNWWPGEPAGSAMGTHAGFAVRNREGVTAHE